MWTEENITELFKSKLKLIKNDPRLRVSTFSQREITPDDIPEYTEIYRESLRMCKDIALHSDPYPDTTEFYNRRFPRATDEEKKDRKDKSENKTLLYFSKAENEFAVIFADGNYQPIWKEQNSEDKQFNTRAYIESEYPVYGSLKSYYASVFLPEKIRDPNAVIVHKPVAFPAHNQPKITQAIIYGCDRIISFSHIKDATDHVLLLTDRKSKVLFGKRKQMVGLVYEFYDDTNIWKITQVGRQVDYTFDIEISYEHNLKNENGIPVFPCDKLKGTPITVGEEILYQSVLFPVIAHLNEAKADESNHTLVKDGFAKPLLWRITEFCTFCHNGKITGVNGEEDCKACKGTGKLVFSNQPGSVTDVMMPPKLNPNRPVPPTPPMGYVFPPVEGIESIRKGIKETIIDAFLLINIDVSGVLKVKTASEVILNLSQKSKMFEGFANEAYNCLQRSIAFIGTMRQKSFNPPVLDAPPSLALHTTTDLALEYNESTKFPEHYRLMVYKQLQSQRFGTADLNKTTLIIASDRLLTLSPLESSLKVAAGLAQKWEDILHTSASNILETVLEKNEKLFEMSVPDQVKLMHEEAKRLEPVAAGNGSTADLLDGG